MNTNKKKKSKNKNQVRFYQKKSFLWSVGIIVTCILLVILSFRISPFPGAFVVKTVFGKDTRQKLEALEAHTPTSKVSVLSNQQYIAGDKDAMLDVYIPDDKVVNSTLPVVIWTHGGAWISGDKTDSAPYYKLLAAKGFIVVAVDYSLAPHKSYPTQINQLNSAHAYVTQHASRFHVDPHKVILAGDSAGAQLSSQLAAIITNPAYAAEVGLDPALSKSDLAAVVLFCGIYKMEGLTHPQVALSKLVSWGNDIAVWSYTGTRDKDSSLVRQMSAYYHVNGNYPKTFISGGNDDPLTELQSVPFANKLESLGVDVTKLFYDKNHSPGLPHEYQFNLDIPDGVKAFDEVEKFLLNLDKS